MTWLGGVGSLVCVVDGLKLYGDNRWCFALAFFCTKEGLEDLDE